MRRDFLKKGTTVDGDGFKVSNCHSPKVSFDLLYTIFMGIVASLFFFFLLESPKKQYSLSIANLITNISIDENNRFKKSKNSKRPSSSYINIHPVIWAFDSHWNLRCIVYTHEGFYTLMNKRSIYFAFSCDSILYHQWCCNSTNSEMNFTCISHSIKSHPSTPSSSSSPSWSSSS